MTSSDKRRAGLSVIGAAVALIALVPGLGKPATPSFRPNAAQESSETVVSEREKHTIEVGLYIVNIHQFSVRDKVYSVEGWYWLRWPQAVQDIMVKEGTALARMIEFLNLIEAPKINADPDTDEPETLSDGRYYWQFKFSGRFYVDDLNLRKSPFETFDLPVTIETRPEEFACRKQESECVYLQPYPENEEYLVGEYAEINGFKLIGTSITSSIHQYGTTFGEEGTPSAFSRVEFNIRYQTDFWSAFIQDVLPVLIILAFVLVSPSLPSSMSDVRLAIPATALLTLIFLQQTYRSEIPSLSYLTFMDWLYAFAYVVSMSLFILFCWGAYRYNAAPEGDQPATVARISGIDTAFQRLAVVGLGLTVLLAWVLTSSDGLA
jgi:hypothetical protein